MTESTAVMPTCSRCAKPVGMVYYNINGEDVCATCLTVTHESDEITRLRAELERERAMAEALQARLDDSGRQEPATAVEPNRIVPSHRCKECGALWRFWRKHDYGDDTDSWTLVSNKCGECCDNAEMREQIEPLEARYAQAYLLGRDHDEDGYVIDKLSKLLAEIAVILKGPEPALKRWSYHDLPAMARALKEAAPVPASDAACKYGDPSCPCQDGDSCHYEGENPWTPPAVDAERYRFLQACHNAQIGKRQATVIFWTPHGPNEPFNGAALDALIDAAMREQSEGGEG